MAIITLKCQNCGDNMQVDESREKVFCTSCGTQNLVVREGMGIDEFLKNGNTFLSIFDFQRAGEAFIKAVEINPADYRGWWGLVAVCTKNFQAPGYYSEYFNKACMVATEEQVEEMERELTEYVYKLNYEIENGVLKKFIGVFSNSHIPAGVTAIGDKAFEGNKNAGFVFAMPDETSGEHTLTSIGNWAFSDCKDLTMINLPESLISIGSWAFYGCSALTHIIIPASVTSIGVHAFQGWSSAQTIVVLGKANQAEADAVFGENWRIGCNAIIKYQA